MPSITLSASFASNGRPLLTVRTLSFWEEFANTEKEAKEKINKTIGDYWSNLSPQERMDFLTKDKQVEIYLEKDEIKDYQDY